MYTATKATKAKAAAKQDKPRSNKGKKKAKAKGDKKILEDVEEPSGDGSGNVIDLMAALKKSVDGDKPAKSSAKKKKSA